MATKERARRRKEAIDDRRKKKHWPVWLYVPNVVGYTRLALVVSALVCYGKETVIKSLGCLVISITLDYVDGCLARQLNQVSSFGSWLDVVVDNFTRGCLYASATHPVLAMLVISVEFLVFSTTQTFEEAKEWKEWKEGSFAFVVRSKTMWVRWTRYVMRNEMKTFIGFLAVFGLHGLPLYLYTLHLIPEAKTFLWPFGLLALAGRFIAFTVEAWVLTGHIQSLLTKDND